MKQQTDSKTPQFRFKGHSETWKTESVSSLLTERDLQAPKNEQYPLMAFIAGQGVAPKGKRYNREFLVSDELNKKYKRTELGDFVYSSNNLETGSIGTNNYGSASISPVYSIFCPTLDGDSRFIEKLLCRKAFINEMVKWRQGVVYGQWRIHESDFLKINVTFPTVDEQTHIGGYFQKLGRLIELHQNKHDKLVTLKKAMLQKMFPQLGTTNPKIRFKGFPGKWVEKNLGDSTKNVGNNTLSRANLNDRSGLAKNIHYGDILVKYGDVLDVQENDVPFISDDAVATKLKSSKLVNGDIVVADAAEDEMVGKCTEIQNVGDQIVLAGLHTIALRPLANFAPFYLGYYLNSDAFHDQLLPIMQGTKVLSISKTAMKRLTICFPTDEAEQEEIGSYFHSLDKLISKHASQLQKLKQIESACLEKMFV